MAKKGVKSDTVTPELEEFINDRTQKNLRMVGKLMPVIRDAVEKDGYGAIDMTEILAICAGSTLLATVGPENVQRIQAEAAIIAEETLKALRARKIGLGTTITGQILGQAKVLSCITQYAALDIYKHLEEEAAKDGNSTDTDQPAPGAQ